MKYIFIPRKGDNDIIADYIKWFNEKSLEELIVLYNKEVRCGITGVHRQALYLTALMKSFEKRLGESPIYLDDCSLGMKGEVELVDGRIRNKSK